VSISRPHSTVIHLGSLEDDFSKVGGTDGRPGSGSLHSYLPDTTAHTPQHILFVPFSKVPAADMAVGLASESRGR
jgi:hypothetical protein